MLKGTKIYSIVANKCPRCHEGDFFVGNNPYNLKKFDKMHPQCPKCNERYEKEPGFYQGAMYMTYAYNVAFMVTSFVLLNTFTSIDLLYILAIVVPCLILLFPVVFRLGRLTWINLFVKYSKSSKS